MVPDPSFPEVLPWLKSLPLAPEYRPTLAEFQDPIAYILKIEQEACRYGICKIVPPLPAAPKSTAVANLNLSFCTRSPSGDPTFTTRQQQIGFCPRRLRPVQKSVWQSGNRYTLPQFEVKARSFERSLLHKSRKKKKKKSSPFLSPLEVESLFWKVATDKPSSVEYANDMPGSGFAKLWEEEAGPGAVAENVGETAWNMRGVARTKGSLLRFMREEIPGVTSPMVYVAMMFSWFAWHVEDHDLHSLNYLHMGAGKTWYGVPRDAAQAFEEVVRVHGYGGEVNPLIAFATLAEKTTLMSPEVLIGSGIPCCRLVQNAGDFVVTFPGSYHSGFSHGFNCGEASNIATPEWLKVAKEAAIRRASTNCPPMVSHYQLLYALALSLCLRTPKMVSTPKSSRLKNKHRCVGEAMIKEAFVQNVMRNNDLLNILVDDGSSCVILPKRISDDPLFSSLHLKLQMKVKPRVALGLCHGEVKKDEYSVTDLSVGSRSTWTRCLNGFGPAEENSDSLYQKMNLSTAKISVFESSEPQSFSSKAQNYEGQNRELQTVGDQGLFSCVTCGILSYACVAIIQPREAAARYLMTANINSFANQTVGFEEKRDLNNEAISKTINSNVDSNLGNKETSHPSVQVIFSSDDLLFNAKVDKGDSALALLASAYGDLSDSEEDSLCETSFCANRKDLVCNLSQQSNFPIDSESIPHNWLPSKEGEAFFNTNDQNSTGIFSSLSTLDHSNKVVSYSSHLSKLSQLHGNISFEYACEEKMTHFPGNQQGTKEKAVPSRLTEYIKITTHSFSKTVGDLPSPRGSRDLDSTCEIDPPNENLNSMMIKNLESNSSGCYLPGSFSDSTITGNTASTVFGSLDDSINNSSMNLVKTLDKNSSRMHVFCLEHAVEVEKQLRALGGANLMLLCHPEYPKIESEAKHLAEELGLDHQWKDIHYRDASEQDREKIRIAIEDEALIPCNGDWAVKLGINLYYSVNLSQSPLFRKQMPYNEVIYKSFSPKSAVELNRLARIAGRRKKIIFSGKWCGKVWMSNQVHPYLAEQNLAVDDETEPSSEPTCYRGNENLEIIPRSFSNKKAADKRKCKKKRRKSAVRSTRIPACSRLDNSSDPKKNVVGEPYTDRSEADLDNDSDKIAILPTRNSANSDSAARKKFDKRKVSADRSSTLKPGHTRLEYSCDIRYSEENSGYAKNADREPNADRSESDTDIEDGKQVILSRRKTSNYNIPSRRKSDKKRKRSTVWSSTRKSAHTRLKDSGDAGCAVENSGNAGYDDDRNGYESSEADTGSELKKESILPRRNFTSNCVATKENSNRRKQSNVNCSRKAAHIKPDSSTEDVYIEGELSVKCDKSLSCLRSPLKGINGEPSNILLRKRRLNPGEAATIVDSDKRSNKRKIKKALYSAPDKEEFPCDIEGCSMSLRTKHDLNLHKRNICPEKGCGKKFFSHKYLLQHRKVHSDDRPLRCPWKGCKMTFKWAWARTEHIRVHTGERPYLCKEPGCDLTFRFVSDFSRHRRKTGH